MPKSPKFLVIEDDFVCQSALSEILYSMYDCTIDVTDLATNALEFVKEKVYECVFLDICLPDVSGDYLANIIRNIDGNLVPIIVVTSNPVDNKCREDFSKLGISDFLRKPVDKLKLKEKLDTYLAN